MENGPLISDLPIKTSIYRVFSITMFDYQRVTTEKSSSRDQEGLLQSPHGVFELLRLQIRKCLGYLVKRCQKYPENSE